MPTYPKVNGHAYDFSSSELTFNDQIFTGVTEFNYTETLEPGVLRGTHAQKLARTRGEYDATGSISMYLEDYRAFVAALGSGYGEKYWDATATYSNEGSPTATTVLSGCRITSKAHETGQGPDGLVVSFDIDIGLVEEDGLTMISDPLV